MLLINHLKRGFYLSWISDQNIIICVLKLNGYTVEKHSAIFITTMKINLQRIKRSTIIHIIVWAIIFSLPLFSVRLISPMTRNGMRSGVCVYVYYFFLDGIVLSQRLRINPEIFIQKKIRCLPVAASIAVWRSNFVICIPV